jgi:hypothetical protein
MANEWLRKPPTPRRRPPARPQQPRKKLATPPVQPVKVLMFKPPKVRRRIGRRNNAAYYAPRKRYPIPPFGTVRGYVIF